MTLADRLAVVIATRDRRDSLVRTLERLVQLPERPRLVVVDNGSSDGSPDAVASSFPHVEVVRLERNLGAAARTVGVRHAQTEYAAFSDDDSWWTAGSLAAAAATFDRWERVAVLAGRILVGEDERLDPTSEQMAASPLPTRDGLPGPRVLGFVACGAVVRSSAFLAAGGFEARLGIGGEEELVAYDLAAAGWDILYLDSLVARHAPAPSRDPAARRRVMLRNRLLTAWVRRPLPVAGRATVTTLRRAIRDPAARGALREVMGSGPWIMDNRRALPATVERELRMIGH